DDIDGLVDAATILNAEEQRELQSSVRPVKDALAKIRKLSYKIIHSTTKILPAWYDILTELEMSTRMLPRDVLTRWNSTFDMLEQALKHREAVDRITQCRDLGL
ncbi:hypothetical protein P692DRAFT_20680702, partial [Suillus brevipes Sb2]